jgi:hypothetical protein
VKRKILVIVLALTIIMLSAQIMAVMPVLATPKEKLDFELYIEGVAMGYGPWGTYHAGPRGTEDDNPEPKELVQRRFHAKQVNFVRFYAELAIDSETLVSSPFEGIFDFAFGEKHSFNFCWNTVT